MSTVTSPAVHVPLQVPVQAPPVSIELPGAAAAPGLREPVHQHGGACYWDLRVCAWVCG